METCSSDKKLVAVLGITVGAGIALTLIYRALNEKGRIPHPVKTQPKRTRATVSSPQRSLLAHAVNPQKAPISPVTGTDSVSLACAQTKEPEDVPALCDRWVRISCVSSYEPEALPRAVELPPVPHSPAKASTHPAPTALSMTHRWRAGVLDALIILFACCVFVGIPQAMRVNAPIDRFDVAILTSAVFLIAVFYVFLFTLGGSATLGQTWQKRRLIRAFEHQCKAQDRSEAINPPGNEFSEFALLAAWTPKLTVPRNHARTSQLS